MGSNTAEGMDFVSSVCCVSQIRPERRSDHSFRLSELCVI